MPWYVDVIIVIVVIGGIALGIYRMRLRLLRLWKEASSKEIAFYKQLEKVNKLFYNNREMLKTEENNEFLRIIARYRKKRVRELLLATRQELFNALVVIYDEIEEHEEEEYKVLQKEFTTLQKVRRLYNSNVLIYNQTINVFPTRYLALRMNLELKEYFG